MAKIEIMIDTVDKESSYIKVDGKKLDDVTYVGLYGLDEPEYMGIEISMYEGPKEEGGLRKSTRLTASEHEFVQDKHIAIAELLKTRGKRI